MFGYVTPLKAEMKVKDYERFKCYYCGLCCHIKNNFGNVPRAFLNYDMTFLGLLLDGLSADEIKVKKHLCALHPSMKKIIIDDNEALSYAAAINIALVYYKFIDDVNDDDNLKSKFKAALLSPYQKKFSTSIIEINNKIRKCLNDLSLLEKNKNFTCIDEICEPFSKLVGIVLKEYPFNLKDDSNELRETLYQLGYSIGKWIYLIDALDDLKSDIEKNKFNPLNYLYIKDNLDYNRFMESIKQRVQFTILNCGYTCMENLNKLNLTRNKDIIFNIIELGLMDKYLKVIENEDKINKSKRSDL
ncbi:hypothetical protein CNEONATNEC26_01578 [Clostridium neonatale]|uniref:DUF5685 family protein n=1 Tax=Clostridium neonatale TaxID=137838 RepID=UPI0012E68B3B|nr:DUF5685 family protein [Clostridium neonatale]SUQ47529.1 hypothetical protein CNEONATNEC26_01578 [Clostridium neonatale]